jgi:Big-like domain-containing protein
MKTARLVLCLALILSGCSDPAPAPAPTPVLTDVLISQFGGAVTDGGALIVGKSVQFTAVAQYSDRTTQTVTSVAMWQSQNTAVATVSAGGIVTGVAPGSSTISATYQGVTGGLTVPVALLP